MKIIQSKETVQIDNNHWTVTHDLRKGGALISVVFHKGRRGNVLTQPLAMGIGPCQDIHETNPTVLVRADQDEITLLFTGTLRDKTGRGNVGYAQSWIYRSYGAHRSQQIFFSGIKFDPRELVLGRFYIHPNYHRVLVQPRKQFWHDGLTETVHYGVAPQSFGFFADTGEGVQFIRGDDPAAWGYNPETLDTTFGDIGCAAAGAELVAELRPFKNHPAPAALLASAQECLSFGSFVGISNYKSRAYLPYTEVSVTSQPFPSDAEIRAFYELGVNVLRIHEGANYVNQTSDHWMDGNFPPYEGAQITEMKRMIRTAHMYGMRVIPYFMPLGVHPTSEAFRTHWREWQTMGIPNQMMRFSAVGDGQVWETYLCKESQFHNWLLDHVTKIIEEYDFDGLYFDSAGTTSLCFHPLHGRIPHATEDAFIRLLLSLRKRFPGKLIFHHQMTMDLNVIHANIVDHIINLEEYGLKMPEELRPLPFGLTAQRACASIGPVPQPWLPKDGEAVSPNLVMTKYKPGKEPTATRQLARRGLPYVIVHGAIPYLYTFMEKLTMGYHTVSDRLDDREGFYYFYRLLKPLAGYRFSEYYAPAERALSASADGIECALMVSDEGTVVILLTSIAAAVATDVVLKPSAEAAGPLHAGTWSKARMIASTRDAAVSLSGHTPAIALDTVHPDELYILEII